MKSAEVNVNFLYHLETQIMEGTKGNIDPKWIKQQQYR